MIIDLVQGEPPLRRCLRLTAQNPSEEQQLVTLWQTLNEQRPEVWRRSYLSKRDKSGYPNVSYIEIELNA